MAAFPDEIIVYGVRDEIADVEGTEMGVVESVDQIDPFIVSQDSKGQQFVGVYKLVATKRLIVSQTLADLEAPPPIKLVPKER